MRQDDILPDGRFVTDEPNNNTQTMLNYSYAGKDNRVYIRYGNGEQDIDLCEYIAQIATSKGCKRTANDIIEGDCMECDCEVAVLYAIAVQAAELREKLRLYEDINPSPQALEGLQMRIDALNDTNRILMDRNSHQVAAVKLFAKMAKESAAHGWNKSIDAIEHELITSFGGEKDGE